jgi:hypothetical protein
MDKLRAIRARQNRPDGLFWMKAHATGVDMQVRAEHIVMAERLDGQVGVTLIYLGAYDREHRVTVAEDLEHLYDRPVLLTGPVKM